MLIDLFNKDFGFSVAGTVFIGSSGMDGRFLMDFLVPIDLVSFLTREFIEFKS